VDGFIAGPDHPLDWVFRYAGPNQEATGPSGRPAPCWAAGEATSWTAERAGTKETPNGPCVALCEESIMDTETGDFFLVIDV
jgi:hypothetical protein